MSLALEPTALIALKNQRLEYSGKTVLDNISLRIGAGEKIALIGKSGSGKSTLLKHLRTSLSQSFQLSQPCAWCPQVLGLVSMLSVYHNIYMGGLERFSTLANLRNLLVPNKKARRDIKLIVEALGLSEYLHTSVGQLSGGQQQRTAIGRALFQEKEILLADEPVSALDDFQSQTILRLLVEKHQTLVLALHDVELARSLCDRIVGLKQGRISFDCASDKLDSNQLSTLYQ